MTVHSRFDKALALGAAALVVATASVLAQRAGSTIPTEKIFAAIGVREAVTVCEIGAGNGDLSLEAARIVGSTGRVFTSELGEERVKTLQNRMTASGLGHVTVVAGDPIKTSFPDAACDALFMRNVYHHFADPAAMNLSIAAALKPGGRLAIVDFSPTSGTEATKASDRAGGNTHGVSADAVLKELKEAGFEPVSTETGAQRWFIVVVAKPKPPASRGLPD